MVWLKKSAKEGEQRKSYSRLAIIFGILILGGTKGGHVVQVRVLQ